VDDEGSGGAAWGVGEFEEVVWSGGVEGLMMRARVVVVQVEPRYWRLTTAGGGSRVLGRVDRARHRDKKG
jgi:hypothetical protein